MIIMAKQIVGFPKNQMSKLDIMKELGWELPDQILKKESAKFAHKIIYNNEPKAITNLIRKPRTRSTAEISLENHPKTLKFKRNFLNKIHQIYNQFPSEIRTLPPKRFKNVLKKMELNDLKDKT